MVLIKKQYFGFTSEIVKVLLEVWEAEYRRGGLMRRTEISCSAVNMVIGFCGGLWGEEVFLVSLKGMLKLWEETRKKKDL